MCSQRLQRLNAVLDAFADFRVKALTEIFGGYSDAQTLCAFVAFSGVVGHWSQRTGGVAGIVPRDDAEHSRCVAHVGSERADAVERRSKGDEPVAGNSTIGRQNTDHSAEACGLANRSAGIGAEGRNGQLAATAAADPPLEPPGTRSVSTGFRTGP